MGIAFNSSTSNLSAGGAVVQLWLILWMCTDFTVQSIDTLYGFITSCQIQNNAPAFMVPTFFLRYIIHAISILMALSS